MIVMRNLVDKIEHLKQSNISNIINNRIKEFKDINKDSPEELFKELCFCILTANFNAEKCITIQKELEIDFLTLSEEDLALKLSQLGHRFPNHRAKYISDSCKHCNDLKDVIYNFKDEELREWLVENIKGLGYKESSHFLRNIGFDNYAIIDFHIIDILTSYNIIKKPNSLTKKTYIEIENKLKEIAEQTHLTLAELDLYLWYMETGNILK